MSSLKTFPLITLSLPSPTILLITLTSPPTNSFTTSLYSSLTSSFHYALTLPITCVLLTSSGPYFSTGVDFHDQLTNYSEKTVKNFMTTVMTFPLPIIAVVQGPAIGIGCTMLFHCDMVFAVEKRGGSKDNYFMTPFVKWCLAPEFCSSVVLGRRGGGEAEMLLFGERVSVRRMRDLGMVKSSPDYTVENIVGEAVKYVEEKLTGHVHSRESAEAYVRLTRLRRNVDWKLEEVMENEFEEIRRRVARGDVEDAVMSKM